MAGAGLQPALVGLLYGFPGLAGIVVIVRIWRKRVDRTLGGDDALLVLGWLLAVVNSILTHLYVLETYGGYHLEDVPFEKIDQLRAQKLLYALGVEYNPVVCIIKMSFLWSLQKLRSRNPYIRGSLWAIQGINAVYMVVAFFVCLFPCQPFEKRFHPEIPGKCYDALTFVLGNVTLVLITDAMVLVIPSWIIWDLQMPLRKKLITISFLSLGLVVIGVGIARLIWFTKIFKGIINNHSVESAYSAIESSVAVIGASGPTVKYIMSRFIPCLKTQAETNKGSSYGYGGNSQGNVPRSRRSRYPTDAYDDLDSQPAKTEQFEMKGDWRWTTKNDSDAHSDEQRITTDVTENGGIVKTVEWSTREDSRIARQIGKDSNTDGRTAVQPANVV